MLGICIRTKEHDNKKINTIFGEIGDCAMDNVKMSKNICGRIINIVWALNYMQHC